MIQFGFYCSITKALVNRISFRSLNCLFQISRSPHIGIKRSILKIKVYFMGTTTLHNNTSYIVAVAIQLDLSMKNETKHSKTKRTSTCFVLFMKKTNILYRNYCIENRDSFRYGYAQLVQKSNNSLCQICQATLQAQTQCQPQ